MGRSSFWRKALAGIAATALATSLGAAGGSLAFADSPCATTTSGVATQAVNYGFLSQYLTSYGVRAGSAGPDYLGITNTNFDFTNGGASATTQYTPSSSDLSCTAQATSLCALNIWGNSAINEAPNRFYANLLYNSLGGSTSSAATTWMSNPGTSSWGDSNNLTSTRYGTLLVENGGSNTTTINGLEYDPDIIWGANKSGGWKNFGGYGTVTTDNSVGIYSTNIYSATHPTEGTPAYVPANNDYVNYDATNVWTQVYSMNSLAAKADSVTTKSVRYNSTAMTSALAYEKAIRGNLLYIASQIDAHDSNSSVGVAKKTVAYLYAIDGNNVAYFFTPTAASLTSGTDKGKASTASYNATTNPTPNPDTNYAANNATVDLGYMGTLPFVTNTFTNGDAISYTDEDNNDYSGICMRVEDIEKMNPAVSVTKANNTNLSGVDVIIYNTNTNGLGTGVSGGKNRNGITNANTLTNSVVSDWLAGSGFTGTLIAGDDWATSKNQPTTVDAAAYPNGTSPRLYCQRNYTADKNARAAWAFSMVYPELYTSKYDSYGYWLDQVYHVKSTMVPSVVQCLCKTSSAVTYTGDQDTLGAGETSTKDAMEDHFATGLNWWINAGVNDDGTDLDMNGTIDTEAWADFAYYSGSSRASFYDNLTDSQEINSTIGIFAPSTQWSSTVSNNTDGQVSPAQQTSLSSGLRSLFSVQKAYADEELEWTSYKTGSNPYLNIKCTVYKATDESFKNPINPTYDGTVYKLVIEPGDPEYPANMMKFANASSSPWYAGGFNKAYEYAALQYIEVKEGVCQLGEENFTFIRNGVSQQLNAVRHISLPSTLRTIGKNCFGDLSNVGNENLTITINGSSASGLDGSALKEIKSQAFGMTGLTFNISSYPDAASLPADRINIVYVGKDVSIAQDAFPLEDGVWKDNADGKALTGKTGELTEAASKIIRFVDGAEGSAEKVVDMANALDPSSESYAQDVAAAKAAYDALAPEKQETISDIGAALTSLAATTVQLDNTKTELDNTKTELDNTKTELDNTKTELDSTKTELDSIKAGTSSDAEALSKLQSQLDAAQKALTTVTVNKATVTKADIAKYANATTVILGKKVKKIAKGAFAGSKVNTVIVQSTKLKKAGVKNCFKGAKKVKTIQVPAKKYKAYKKIFTKKITKSTKKLTVM